MKTLIMALSLAGLPAAASGQDAAPISGPIGAVTILDDGVVSRAKVSVIDDGKFLEFKAVAPEAIWVSYDIDVNADGKVDDMKDLKFAADAEGEACAAYLLVIEEGASTTCGEFKTKGRYVQTVERGIRTAIWRIPHAELAQDGKRFGITILYFDGSENYIGAPMVYAFAGAASR